ncbi:MAG: hypothetical protein AAGJ35_03300 [Myxococcota bacterium]
MKTEISSIICTLSQAKDTLQTLEVFHVLTAPIDLMTEAMQAIPRLDLLPSLTVCGDLDAIGHDIYELRQAMYDLAFEYANSEEPDWIPNWNAAIRTDYISRIDALIHRLSQAQEELQLKAAAGINTKQLIAA